jgi:tetratricopeptide (TPR) repeat protein
MKICPFISHMIGEDRTGVLEIDSSTADVDAAADFSELASDGGVGVKARPKKDAQTRSSSSHLFCLRETCRFYRQKDGECSFDAMFERAEAKDKADKSATASQKKDLDKFWQFQTKSVSEMIASLAESDKKNDEALTRLEKDLRKRFDELSAKKENDDLQDINRELSRLHEAAKSREEGMEALSNTVSQMMMDFEDGLKELKEHSTSLSGRFEQLESSVPRSDEVRALIEESLGPDDEVRSLKEQLASLVESNSKFEENLREWQNRLDTRVDEIRERGEKLAAGLDTLAKRPEKEPEGKGSSPEQKKKARNLNNLGVTSFHNGQFELARDQFQEAVALDDGFAECYNNLGLVLTELGQEDAATDAFSRAIKLNPDLHSAYNNLGYVFYKQGSYDQAVEMYNEALGRSASNSPAYTNLGNAYFKQGKKDEARKAWEKALELDPSNRQATRGLKDLDRG